MVTKWDVTIKGTVQPKNKSLLISSSPWWWKVGWSLFYMGICFKRRCDTSPQWLSLNGACTDAKANAFSWITSPNPDPSFFSCLGECYRNKYCLKKEDWWSSEEDEERGKKRIQDEQVELWAAFRQHHRDNAFLILCGLCQSSTPAALAAEDANFLFCLPKYLNKQVQIQTYILSVYHVKTLDFSSATKFKGEIKSFGVTKCF